MDPRIIRQAGEGPQVAYLTQNTSRLTPRRLAKDVREVKDHVPWTVRWEEYPATDTARDGTLRFVLPSEGDLLHASYLVLTLRGVDIPLPAGPNLIRDATLRCDGDVVDRVEGEWISIQHDSDRGGNRHICRDILGYNVPGTVLSVNDDETLDVMIDLPFFYRDQAAVSRGIPLFLLKEDRHECHVRTRYPCILAEDTACAQVGCNDGAFTQPDTTLPSAGAPKEDTWVGRTGNAGGIIRASMVYEISDLPSRDRYGIRGFAGSLLSSRIPNPGWSLPVVTRTFMEIPLQGRQHHSVILPFQNEMVGFVFALRPLFHQRAGRNTRFDGFRTDSVNQRDLDETTLDTLYTEPDQLVVGDRNVDCPPAELLKDAELVVGNMVLERREALWWRQDSWLQSGRTPPTRTRFVYGRFWDTDPRVPSGGTFLEHMPRTELRLNLHDSTPDCTLLLWGLRRTTAMIHDQVLRIKDLHA